MAESIGRVMEVIIVVVDPRGWLIGGSFDVIDVELALPIGRSRIWHVCGTSEMTRMSHDARAQRLRGP
jgi:hypothetical protein